jgi:DNA-binding PadR family transcriptional regulator
MSPRPQTVEHQILAGFIRIHILYHAAQAPLHGAWLIDELSRHDYRLSPGTLYPMLHGMERRGYLRSEKIAGAGAARRVYRCTRRGLRALELARSKLRELIGEVLETDPPSRAGRR